MKWIILNPFSHNTNVRWIPEHINDENIEFKVVPADYSHDRSRENSSSKQWLDFLRHALKAWFSAGGKRKEPQGFITCFPQLPLILGCLKRITFSKRVILAWTFNLGRTYGGMKGKVAKFGFAAVDKFIVHSREEIEIYSSWLNIPQNRFEFVPLAVLTTNIEQAVLEEKEKYSNTTEPYVVALGTANRDYSTLIEAMKNTGYRTIIVSGQSAVANIKLPENIEVKSGLSLKACHQLALNSTVNVVPIKNRNAPSGQVTFIEAMMMGKATVVTNCSGSKDYIKNGHDGLLVQVGSVQELEHAIRTLWENTKVRSSIEKNAKEKAFKDFRLQSVAPLMKKILLELMQTRL